MRLLLTLAVLALSFACVFATTTTTPPNGSVGNPNTPADGATSTQLMCLMDSLSFTNGLTLLGTFQPNVFHYQCSCLNWGEGPFTTVVKPHMYDWGSSAEVTFNGQMINFRSLGSGISNGGPSNQAPKSPYFESFPLTFVTGLNTIKIGVGCNGRATPNTCYYEYVITCTKPGEGGGVVGDPQFAGLRGQQYQVHGVAGEVYNIVSDDDLQYNSKFVFLNSGACPVVNGKKQKGCFSHPGSYLGELGLKTRAGDRVHIKTGTAAHGFTSVAVNGKALAVGDSVLLADNLGSVSLNNTHLASVQIGNWDFAFENSDRFVNQKVRVLDSRNLRSHGLLGQTWRETTYPNSIKYIQGAVDDYVIREGDVFGDNFLYNQFN